MKIPKLKPDIKSPFDELEKIKEKPAEPEKASQNNKENLPKPEGESQKSVGKNITIYLNNDIHARINEELAKANKNTAFKITKNRFIAHLLEKALKILDRK